jgi:adenylate cyclase
MTDDRVERRLAAILAADVAGYSRLIGLDEVGTLRSLKTWRRELVDPEIASCHGRIVKTTGDGFLAEFSSVVDAVTCAVKIQSGMKFHSAATIEDRRIVFRIGLNVGDVIIDGQDIFGDGVNIAARLETICEPGGICVSAAAHDQVRDKLPFNFASLGEQSLKNIARPIVVYHLPPSEITSMPDHAVLPNDPSANEARNGPDGLALNPRPAGERGARPSVAVLPFDNLSRDGEIVGFCDGLVEDVITALSKFRWLNIASRNSSFAHKGRSADVRHIAREMGVRFVLEGSVRKSDRRIRATAQLIDGVSGNHLWAEKFDRDYSDLFDLQDEITRDIVASLEYVLWVAMVRGDLPTEPPDRATSPLRAAGWHIAECTRAGNHAAIACATEALKFNSRSVAAHQYLANAYILELFAGWTKDAKSDIENLLEASRQATALSPADSLSQGLSGCALAFAGNHDDALAQVRAALRLNNNSVNVLGPCANALAFSGQFGEANEMIDRMLRLAPAHYFRAGFLSQMALNWLRLGEPERGLPLVGEALRLKPEALCAHAVHAAILNALGRPEAVDAEVSETFRQRPDLDRTLIRSMFPHRDRSIPDGIADLFALP